MRYVTCLLRPEAGHFDAIHRALSRESGVVLERIHHIHMLGEGRAVVLYGLDGGVDHISGIFDEQPDVDLFDVSRGAGGVYVYVHCWVNELVEALLRVPRNHEIIAETPMVYTDDGGLRVTLVGEEGSIRRAIYSLPSGVSRNIERTGKYLPYGERLYSQLTDRQRETLRVAVQRGYFEDPRSVTYADIADELDVSPGTVGTIIRKVEATVMPAIVP